MTEERGKTFVEFSDRLAIRNERGYDWIEGDPAFPDEIEVALYRRERSADFDGHRLIESHRYRRVDR